MKNRLCYLFSAGYEKKLCDIKHSTQFNIKNSQNPKWYHGLDLGVRKRTLVEINMDTIKLQTFPFSTFLSNYLMYMDPYQCFSLFPQGRFQRDTS